MGQRRDLELLFTTPSSAQRHTSSSGPLPHPHHPPTAWAADELLTFQTIPSPVQTGFPITDQRGHSKDPARVAGHQLRTWSAWGRCGSAPAVQSGQGKSPASKVRLVSRTITFFFL